MRQQIALAGYRLAQILNEINGPDKKTFTQHLKVGAKDPEDEEDIKVAGSDVDANDTSLAGVNEGKGKGQPKKKGGKAAEAPNKQAEKKPAAQKVDKKKAPPRKRKQRWSDEDEDWEAEEMQ